MDLSPDALRTGGILLLTVPAIEFGGAFLLRIVRGSQPATSFQAAFFRAGHAHAGVLVVLGLVCQLFVDAADLSGAARAVARGGVPLGAILVPAGFFFSAMGRGEVTGPNRFIVLIWLGVAAVAAGVLTLGVGLVTA